MKGFFGAFIVFILWTSACIYYVSIREVPSNINLIAERLIQVNPEDNNISKKLASTTPIKQDSVISTFDTQKNANRFNPDRNASQRLAEEIQKSIAISDTIDIEKDEPTLSFEKEIETFTGPSFSSRIFFPSYNNTDLILDKELVRYATELKQLLKNQPDKKVTILGHTDNVGSSRDNFRSGLKKSRQIKWYLTARRGIPRSKITATSRGEEEPIESNNSAWGRKKNNRIEIIID